MDIARSVSETIPAVEPGPDFTGSDACRKCHQSEHASWFRTWHRTMTQQASPDSVLGDFEGVNLSSRGRSYQLSREGDRFFAVMANPDWEREQLDRGIDVTRITDPPIVKREIVLTTGSHHFQQYWVTSRYGNALHNLRMVWDIELARWMPREDAFLEPPDGRRHFKVWNVSCINCHSVGGRPGYVPQTGALDSRVVEFGISCEACHGPGAEHVRVHEERSRTGQPTGRAEHDPIVNPARSSQTVSAEICGQCHSSSEPRNLDEWLRDGLKFRAGNPLADRVHILTPEGLPDSAEPEIDAGNWWQDGTIRVGGREYQGLIASPCFQHGEMTCLSCHSMHKSNPDDQLAAKMDGDQGCLQCHESVADNIESHTHHSPLSSGSRCYNCHMPYTSYALLKAIRTHRIDSPSVTTSIRTGRPNACNQCHLDRSFKWSARHLEEWYGISTKGLADGEHDVSASLGWLLKGDAVQRVLAAWTLGWEPAREASGERWQAAFLARLLEDPYSAVRYTAGRSLKRLPGFEQFEFDFVAPSEELRRFRQQAGTLALEHRRLPTKAAPGEILMNEAGDLLTDLIEQLASQRNDRPVELPE